MNTRDTYVFHIPRKWDGAERAWCGRDLAKIKAWPSKVQFLNGRDEESCKHCLIKLRSAPVEKCEGK